MIFELDDDGMGSEKNKKEIKKLLKEKEELIKE